MKSLLNKKWWIFATVIILSAICLSFINFWGVEEVDYNTQVKPILNKRCISCHGGVKKSGGLNLMTRAHALDTTDSGQPAIIPGDARNSEFIQRLYSKDPLERMPFESDPLPEHEKKILKKWVEQGAKWDQHWAYIPVEEVAIPQVAEFENWPQNYIDHLISNRWKEQSLKPSPKADANSLLRRLSMDIIGIPLLPDQHEMAQHFLAHPTAQLYEGLVDSLLNSPHFGERWASMWLDIARYADTKGYERDVHRSMFRYRDYVIQAFNQDMPYNQFITENLAGDLLDQPSESQYIATGFHRNTPTNDEGGTDNEEFRVAAVIDRVNTTWEGLLGTSFACTQCHGHPYDPFPHEEYYEFLAFFNNSRDEDTFEDYPWIRHLDSVDQEKLRDVKEWVGEVADEAEAQRVETFVKTFQPAVYSIETDEFVNSDLYDTKHLGLRDHGSCRMPDVDLTEAEKLIYRFKSNVGGGTWWLHVDSLNGPILTQVRVPETKGKWKFAEIALNIQIEGIHDLYFRYEYPGKINPDKPLVLFDWFSFQPEFPAQKELGAKSKASAFWELLKADAPYSLIMKENTEGMARTTQVFDRGNWLVQTDTVFADVPDVLPDLDKELPNNRLGLARWIANEQNPLTARNFVNHVWEQIFGKGLVETLEDFGTQGSPPTHPELLDALSWKFMHEHDWSVKALIKDIVLSATYQQSAKLTEEALEIDPYNIWYARGARFRWSAEQVRDQTLAVSGLLSTKMYGPSVMPYQPEGIWDSPYNQKDWEMSEGEDRFRRSVYTYWKRGAPFPAMITFDAPSRVVCESRRIRTNTPLQALNTLNDEGLLDAARYFAIGIDQAWSEEIYAVQIQKAYEYALGRSTQQREIMPFIDLYANVYMDFLENPSKTACFLEKWPEHESAHIGALTIVCNSIFNLDEFLTKS